MRIHRSRWLILGAIALGFVVSTQFSASARIWASLANGILGSREAERTISRPMSSAWTEQWDPTRPPHRGLPVMPIPADNPMSTEKIALGRQLFFDKRLSADDTVSCASCHDPAKGWSNGEAVATGIGGKKGTRNVPTLLNVGLKTEFFWDGRSTSLEEQAWVPILDPVEMGMPSKDAVVSKLSQIEGYRKQFEAVFGSPMRAEHIGMALAAFERTLQSGDAPRDRWLAGDKSALSASATRGFRIFSTKARCSRCHADATLSVGGFSNIALPPRENDPDPGRHAVTGNVEDLFAFKTPTLRELRRTAPYMHDGRLTSLDQIIDHYAIQGEDDDLVDSRLRGFRLTGSEQKDLIAFLEEGFNGGTYPDVSPPALPE